MEIYNYNINDTQLNDEQKEALYKIFIFLSNNTNNTNNKLSNMIGIFGQAGTGKTTLIKFIVNIKNLYKFNINKIVLASPTNKALDVIKEKLINVDNNIDISFMTIAQLLSYKKSYDKNHNIIFSRMKKTKNIHDNFDLIIIDESSMITEQNIIDINNDFYKAKNKKPIIFTGDSFQLPPTKEKLSKVFSSNFDLQIIELKNIMRTNKDKIKNLSLLIRDWINEPYKYNLEYIYTEIGKYKCEYINFLNDENKFINNFLIEKNAVILVWTNNERIKYNNIIRKKLFGNVCKEKYLIGEQLIFNNFYKCLSENELIMYFYSSMTAKILNIKIIENFSCKKFEINNIILLIKNYDNTMVSLYNYIQIFIDKFNQSIDMKFKIYKIECSTTKYSKININVIYNNNEYDKDIELGKKYIKTYFEENNCDFPLIKDNIHDIIISLFNKYYEEPFANVDYGYSMTVDKSQGSTFENVYINGTDILDNIKHPYLDFDTAKRRFYTAITRASESINILFI